jgi:RNA polymerase primary sigma factor
LYDSILEEFDDEAVRVPEEDEGFAVQAVAEIDIVEDDAELDVVETAADVDVPLKLDEEEILTLSGDTESWSDDPVRMYLTQMGEIPLLTRQQEIYLAKKIELTRRRFRTKLLECDYVIQQAYKVLKRVHEGELPFDRTVQVSVTDRLEKDQIPAAAQPAHARCAAEAKSPGLFVGPQPHGAQAQAEGCLDSAVASPPSLRPSGRRARFADPAH